MTTLDELYEKKMDCEACGLRDGCSQVVPGIGCRDSPKLLVVGEAPGQEEDEQGVPFVGRAGQVLREALRESGSIKRSNTLITNVLGCRPPKNRFPKNDCPDICVAKWLEKEIKLAAPERMLLLGGRALWYVGRMQGITANRGQWFNIKGIRTMATFHPSYILRCDTEGKTHFRKLFEEDIQEVADEVGNLGQ